MSDRYVWIKATVSGISGRVTFTYQVEGLLITGTTTHEEDVTDWSDGDIRRLGADLLDAQDQIEEIVVDWQ